MEQLTLFELEPYTVEVPKATEPLEVKPGVTFREPGQLRAEVVRELPDEPGNFEVLLGSETYIYHLSEISPLLNTDKPDIYPIGSRAIDQDGDIWEVVRVDQSEDHEHDPPYLAHCISQAGLGAIWLNDEDLKEGVIEL